MKYKKSNTSHSPQLPPQNAAHPRANTGREKTNPVDYQHRYESMADYAKFLALHYDCNRTRHAYYRQLRLLQEHFDCDPRLIDEERVRDYLLFVKLKKCWHPTTIRQAVACFQRFFVDVCKFPRWDVFSQITTKSHDVLPPVLTRREVQLLLSRIRLRRYRIPLKLIYCCGLRLSECLALTIHDIKGSENKLIVREGKGMQDRVVPLAQAMLEDLRAYYRKHRHPLYLFPNVGRGIAHGEEVEKRMRNATAPMPHSSLQRLMIMARKELNLPAATIHGLRHSFATHMIEKGASLHTVQYLLGHKQIDSTMIYLHLTVQSQKDTRVLMDAICRNMPS